MIVASPSRWDEACFAVPAVRALAAAGIEVTVVCRAEQEAFWQTLPEIEVLAAAPKAGVIASTIHGKSDTILLWEDGPIAKAAKKARIPRRLGPAVDKLAKHLTDPIAAQPDPLDHRVQFYLKAVAELGIETAKPEFFAPADLGIAAPARSVLLVPDSDFGPSHEWPLDRWQEVAQKLVSLGIIPTIASLPNHRGLSNDLHATLGEEARFEPIDLSAPPLSMLASHSLVVGADSSVPHLASHVGATCITLFGPNDRQWKRPLGVRHSVVVQHVECAPCLMAKCPLDMRCQNELEATAVIAAVVAAL